MPRCTVISSVALAALATTMTPSLAAEVSYEQHDVRSNPKEGPSEHVTIDVPDSWERDRLNRVSVGFFDYTTATRSIVVDLDPVNDTPKEMRAEVQTLRDLGPRYYREHDFRVNGEGDGIRVRWVFAYRDAQTDDHWSYTSVFLIDDERLVLDGARSDKDELKELRTHVVSSFEIQK
jgi:hypothetical protein